MERHGATSTADPQQLHFPIPHLASCRSRAPPLCAAHRHNRGKPHDRDHRPTDDLRPYAWGATATLILLPLFLLKLADPNAWAWADLPFAVVMIVAVGIAFEVALRLPLRWTFRAGAALAIATAFLLTWGNLAVGFAG